MATEPAISIKGLCYSYPGGGLALKDVSLEIQKGELIALLGPNGAGKSSLLLHLNGVLKGAGSVKISGKEVAKIKRSELIRTVGVVFQDPDDQLFMPTIFEDVAYGPLNMGLSEDAIKGRVETALKKVNLSGFEDRSPMRMSFGEKKKASLATVLSMEPDIIVLDEPTANLDPKSRNDIIQAIRDLKQQGKTIIIATHDLEFVPALADRIYVLDRTIIASGTPKEILLDTELLKRANLEIPGIAVLFEILRCFGYDAKDLPLSMGEAVTHLTKTMETGGGHMHMHVHEHTHEDIKDLRKKHERHFI
jgi:cobalt/nickel transport system ATP-binding protein